MEVETKFTDTEPVESPSVAWHADFDTRSRGVSGFIEKTNDDCTVGGNTRGVQRETPRVNIRDTIRMAIREISFPRNGVLVCAPFALWKLAWHLC